MSRKFKALIIFSTFSVVQFITSCSQNASQRSGEATADELVKLAKPAVVRIVDGCRGEYVYNAPNQASVFYPSAAWTSGSGFFIHSDGYIVTNSHVVQSAIDRKEASDKAKKVCEDQLFRVFISKIARDRGYAQDLTTYKKIDDWMNAPENKAKVEFFRTFSRLRSDVEFVSKVILPAKNAEALTFQVRSHGTVSDKLEGSDVAVIKVETRNAPALKLGNSDKVKYNESVTTFGYPAAADLQDILKEESSRQVTVTPATVSNPAKRQQDNAPLLQLNLTGEKGRSGGPILNQTGEVIGMVTYRGINPNSEDSDTSISFATPVNTIKQFIGMAGTTNEQGEVQEWYRQGLKSFYGGDLRSAKQLFDRVKANYPDHSEIDELIVRAQEPGSDPDYLRYLPWIVGLILLVGLGVPAIAFSYLKRRKSSQQPARSSIPNVMSMPKSSANGSAKSHNGSATSMRVQPFIELSYQNQVLQFDLGEKEIYRLGRDADWSDFEIPESWDSLSRRHAVLRQEGMDYKIYDGDGSTPSKYGIHFGSTRISATEGHMLRNGTQLKIGSNRGNPVLLSYFNPMNARPAPAPTRIADD